MAGELDSQRRDTFRVLFDEYQRLMTAAGTPPKGMNRDRFVEALERQRKQLIEQQGCADVTFTLVERDGRPAIQPQLITGPVQRPEAAAPEPASEPATDPDRIVFDKYVAMRKRLGQVHEGFVYEKFKAQLEASRQACIQRLGWPGVKFVVAEQDGKAAILPQPDGLPRPTGKRQPPPRQEARSAPAQEPAAKPRPAAKPKPAPAPAAEPKPKPAPAPAAEPKPEPAPAPAAEPKPEPAPAAAAAAPAIAAPPSPAEIGELETKVKRDPNDADAVEALADACAAAGDASRAKELYGQAEGLFHDTGDVVRMDVVGRKLRQVDLGGSGTATGTGGTNIALLEVDDALANQMKNLIAGFGKQVDVISEVNTVFEKVNRARHAALIMDFDLGGRNPYAVCSRLKTYPDTAEVPLIALMPEDTSAEQLAQDRGSTWAAQSYVLKPLDETKLKNAFAEIGLP